MNFEFIRECRLESDELQTMYDWSARSIIIGENRRNAASFCARQQSGSAGFIIPTIKSVIRRTLRWKSFCVIRTKMSTT